MSRFQLAAIAALSVLATIAILAGGVGASGDSAAIRAALGKRAEINVSLPATASSAVPAITEAGPAPAPAAAGADDEIAASPTPSSSGGAGKPAATAGDDASGDADAAKTAKPVPKDEPRATHVKHVFVITLAGHGFDATFGPQSAAPYLSKQLRPQGALLTNYRSLGTSDLADHLALISGQPPNADTRAGCPVFKEIPPATKPSQSGEITAPGCAYPNTVTTIADQLTGSRRTWRAYIEDLDKGPAPKAACRRPGSNAPDDTQHARPGDGYATRHNPFVYFHALTDLGGCDASDGPLERLDADLASVKTTPNFVYVAPNLCNSATESPCADGSAGGLPVADAFLATWVPKILASPAYKADGVLIVTFAGSVPADPADKPARNGALVVSRFATAGSSVDAPLDPYALLRSVEDLFSLRPLARAAKAGSLIDDALAAAQVKQPGDD